MHESELEIVFVTANQLATGEGIPFPGLQTVNLNISGVEDAVQGVVVFLMSKLNEALQEKGSKIVIQSPTHGSDD